METRSTASPANPPTRLAEMRREASDRSRASFIEETLKTGKPGSMLWVSCRICGSSRVAGRDVRNTTQLTGAHFRTHSPRLVVAVRRYITLQCLGDDTYIRPPQHGEMISRNRMELNASA